MATRARSSYTTYDKNLPPALAQALQHPPQNSRVGPSMPISSPFSSPNIQNLIDTRGIIDSSTSMQSFQIRSSSVNQQDVVGALTFQERLYSFFQKFTSQPELSSQFISSVTSEFREVCQALNDNERKARFEHESLRAQLRENQRLLCNSIAERDRACRERDETIDKLNKQQGHQRIIDRLRETEQSLKRLTCELQEKVRIRDEQVSGKRALWLENHPSSSARSTQHLQDPYCTPTSKHGHGYGLRTTSGDVSTARNLRAQFEQLQSNTRIPKAAMLEDNLPSGLSNPDPIRFDIRASSHNAPGSKANYGGSDTPPEEGKMALIPFKSEEQVAEEFIDDIAKCWNLIDTWARSYANLPNDLAIDQRISKNKESWQEMLSLTYTDSRDAHGHVINLVRDETTRRWFVMRMVVHYICKHIWDFSAWKTHDIAATEKIAEATSRLKVKGLTSLERADAVALQTSAVQAIVGGDDFLTYRTHRLSQHTKQLREWVGPMLNSKVTRGDAGKDIGAIAVHAFDLSVRMHTSGWSFQLMFPECGGKFGSTSMICRDESITETPLELQIRQVRLKLVITPVVTIRDDRGVSIRVKQLHCANVLIMG